MPGADRLLRGQGRAVSGQRRDERRLAQNDRIEVSKQAEWRHGGRDRGRGATEHDCNSLLAGVAV